MKAMRQNFAPIWEQYGVDLVLCGHSHVYERSYLVKGAYGDAADINFLNFVQNTNGVDSLGQAFLKYTQGANPNQGTVYVVCGNSGSTDPAPGLHHPYMYTGYGCDTCVGSFILDINGNRLDGRHLDGFGNIRDHFTIKKIDAEDPNAVHDLQADGWLSEFKIAPNPFSSSTNVSFDLKQTEKVVITINDAVGKRLQLFEGELQQGNQHLEINAQKLKLAKGIYNLQVIAGGKSASRNLVIQ
jgi:hypothetical protein